AIGPLEGSFRCRGEARISAASATPRSGSGILGSWTARQRDQCNRTFARCNRFSRVADMKDVGGATRFRGIQMAKLPQAHVVRHRHRAEAGRIARAEIAIDVVLAETSVL